MTHLVFIYGTLKKNHRNHDQYMSDAKYICEASTKEKSFIMTAFHSITSPGNYSPGIYKTTNDGGLKILGEVYEVTDDILAKLDELEGIGDNYNRETASLENGMSAYIYVKIERSEHPNINDNPRIQKTNTCYAWRDPL